MCFDVPYTFIGKMDEENSYPQSIGLPDDQFDLVVCCFDPCIAQAKSDRVQNVYFVSADLLVKLFESRDPAVARLKDPVLQIFLCLILVSGLQKQPQRFLQTIGSEQLWVICLDHIQPDFLVLGEMFRCLAE